MVVVNLESPGVVERDRRFPFARAFREADLVVTGGIVIAHAVADAAVHQASRLKLVDEVGELGALLAGHVARRVEPDEADGVRIE